MTMGQRDRFWQDRPTIVTGATGLLEACRRSPSIKQIVLGADLKPDIQDEASKEIRCQYLSAVKAGSMLGWRPLFTLDEGLQREME